MAERRKVLNYIINNYKPTIKEEIVVSQPVMVDDCRFCGVCSRLCPNGALKQIEEDDEVTLHLDNLLCSGCNLCNEVCFYKAIVLKEIPFIGQSASILARGFKFNCIGCGNIHVATREIYCPACQEELNFGGGS